MCKAGSIIDTILSALIGLIVWSGILRPVNAWLLGLFTA
jgi:hypothetical protein